VVGGDVQPAWPVVHVQNVLDLVRERRCLYYDEDEHDQRV